MTRLLRVPIITSVLALFGCAGAGVGDGESLPVVPYVDLERFMGDWYVVANIPTFIERGAHNAVENYRLADDGSIDTTFTFREGDFDGPEKRYRFTGYVRDTQTNSRWGMQMLWPFTADYRIAHVDDDYTETIIARERRDYVWVMTRRPTVTEAELTALLARVESMGYDMAQVERVPQRW